MRIKFKKNIILVILIVIIIFVVSIKLLYFNKETFTNKLDFTVKDSSILPKGERGLFANKNYNKGDIIEICPTLKMSKHEIDNKNILNHHFFQANNVNNDNDSLISLGYCSLINHSKKNQNCSWKVSKDDNKITMYAIKPIKIGEEFYSNYGDGYWNGKNNQI